MTTKCERNRNILIVLKCHSCGAVSGSSALTKAHFRKLHENCKRERKINEKKKMFLRE
jgi:hypothetical protein